MAKAERAPRWLTRLVVDAIHADQLREHGGLPGVRDENALESALARPQQKWSYAETRDVPMLAAAYAYGLVRNHPYRDGNKRIGLLALATFLGIKGFDLTASDEDVVAEFVRLAAGEVTEQELTAWTRLHSRTRRRNTK